MFCSRCGAENSADSVFCKKCGSPLKIEPEQKNNSNNNKKYLVISGAIAIVIVLIAISMFSFNNPVSAFKKNITNNQPEEATKIYNEEIKGDGDREEKVLSFLEDEIVEIQKSYSDEKIDYTAAKARLDTIRSTQLVESHVESALKEMDNLYNSRLAFKKANEYLKNKDLLNALKEYQKVSKEDKNYYHAQEQIVKNKKEVKKLVLKNVEEYAKNQEYGKAVRILADALTVIPNDTDLLAKESVYQKAQDEKLAAKHKQEMEELIAKQELTVGSTNVVPDYFSLHDQAQVIVKNNTQKVVKNFTVGILMYDNNGYPVKSGIIAGETELFRGKADAVNIQPGQSFGSDNVWNLYTDYGTVSKINACVIDVDYFDGSSWSNDYFTYWQDEHLGMPYK
jgi:tetratricopeptide (TPR) repeat protein